MKKSLLILLISFVSCLLLAQDNSLKQLHVVGKSKKTDELVSRRDSDGNFCAALKIISDLSNFAYVPNEGTIGEVDHLAPGTDIVYVSKRERVLEIHKLSYEPLKIILSEHNIHLKLKEVWEIHISGDKEVEKLPVTFQVMPNNAKLTVDDNTVHNEKPVELDVGDHIFRAELTGFEIIEEIISVNKEHVLFKFQMHELEDIALQIGTDPAGAIIRLDNARLGESPISVFYPRGTYPLVIRKEGYLELEIADFEVAPPKTYKHFTLEENVGYITINTNSEAKRIINGRNMPASEKLKYSPQLLQIEVNQNKADTIYESLVLKRNDNVVLDLFPQIITGIIQIAVTPFEARIELSGDAGEYYTSIGMNKFNNIPKIRKSFSCLQAGGNLHKLS